MTKYLHLSIGLILISIANLNAQTLLDTIIVSGAKVEQSLLNSNRNVQIISKEEIESAPVNSVAELLDFAMGVDARQRGIFGTQTDLSIRGGTFEQVLVLINGVRLADPQTGHHLMNLPVAIEDIERIEILMGGGSALFGANAFSGAINIITKKAKERSTSISIDAGQYETYLARVQQNLVGENWQGSISGSRNQSAGFKRNTDFIHSNISGQASYSKGSNRIRLQGGYTDQAFGAQDFYSTNFPDQFEQTKTLFGSLNWEKQLENTKINHEVYWRRNWDEFQLFRENGDDFYNYQNGLFIAGSDTAPAWYRGHNYHRSDVAGARVNAAFTINQAHTTALSLDFRHEQVLSNNLGDSLDESIALDDSRGVYYLGADRQNLSLSAQHLYSAKAWSLSAALQANYNSDFGLGFYPALNAGYRASKAHKLYANFNRSFRFPSYTDLYYRLGNAQGSIDLEEEESYNYELGYRFYGKGWYANANVFYRNGTNIIDWTQACDTCNLIATNTSTVNMTGVELSARKNFANPSNALLFEFAELGYTYMTSDSPGSEELYNSLYVFDHLTQKINLRAQQRYNNWVLNYYISYQERNGEYFNAELGRAVDYDPVMLINLSVGYQWNRLQLRLQAQNLLDQRYFDRGNVEMPGIWAQVGATYSFKY